MMSHEELEKENTLLKTELISLDRSIKQLQDTNKCLQEGVAALTKTLNAIIASKITEGGLWKDLIESL